MFESCRAHQFFQIHSKICGFALQRRPSSPFRTHHFPRGTARGGGVRVAPRVAGWAARTGDALTDIAAVARGAQDAPATPLKPL
jgi:hypothetical protein